MGTWVFNERRFPCKEVDYQLFDELILLFVLLLFLTIHFLRHSITNQVLTYRYRKYSVALAKAGQLNL